MSGLDECVCHEWHDTEEIGGWLHHFGVCASYPVRKLATEAIWELGYFDTRWGREKLTALIAAAGRIGHAHALKAFRYETGAVELKDGLHRWSIARDLGIKRLPVDMRHIPPETD